MTTVPPVSLSTLYTDLDFLAGISDKQKYCFGGRYYTDPGWIGLLFRLKDNEKQDVNGISKMELICKDAAEQWETYKNNRLFGPTLMNKVIAARHGLQRCVNTYESLQKITTASNIKNRAILLLDNIIPHDRKLREGIIQPENEELNLNDTKRDQSSVLGRSPEIRMVMEPGNDVIYTSVSTDNNFSSSYTSSRNSNENPDK